MLTFDLCLWADSPAMTRVGGQHSRVHVLSRSPVHMDGDEHLLRITSQLKTAEVLDTDMKNVRCELH